MKDLIEYNWTKEDGGGNCGYDGSGGEIIPKLGKMKTGGMKESIEHNWREDDEDGNKGTE